MCLTAIYDCPQKTMKSIRLSLLTVVLLHGSIACQKKEEDPGAAIALLAVAVLSTPYRGAFVAACTNGITNFCLNYYGTFSAATCSSMGDTTLSSKCPTTNSIGVCTSNNTRNDTVYYTGNLSCSNDTNCSTFCMSQSGSGVYNGTYLAN